MIYFILKPLQNLNPQIYIKPKKNKKQTNKQINQKVWFKNRILIWF